MSFRINRKLYRYILTVRPKVNFILSAKITLFNYIKIFCLKSAKNFSEQRDLNDAVRKFIESFRKTMPCGIPAWGIPILAPIRADNLKIDINLAEMGYASSCKITLIILKL